MWQFHSFWCILLVVVTNDLLGTYVCSQCTFLFSVNEVAKDGLFDCSSSNLRRIPESMSRQYKTLDSDFTGRVRLDYNIIKYIHANDTFNMVNIILFEIANNAITYIEPEALSNMRQLAHFDMSHNQMKHIKRTTFAGVTLLERLIACHNQIEYIEDGSFDDLEKVKYINLGENKLTKISAAIFSSYMKKLKTLYLHKNQISDLQPGALSNNGQLRIIDLDDNKLTQIFSGTFHGVEKYIKLIYLKKNPLTCISIPLSERASYMMLSENQKLLESCGEDTNIISTTFTAAPTPESPNNEITTISEVLATATPTVAANHFTLHYVSIGAIVVIGVIVLILLYFRIKNKTSQAGKLNDGGNDQTSREPSRGSQQNTHRRKSSRAKSKRQSNRSQTTPRRSQSPSKQEGKRN